MHKQVVKLRVRTPAESVLAAAVAQAEHAVGDVHAVQPTGHGLQTAPF